MRDFFEALAVTAAAICAIAIWLAMAVFLTPMGWVGMIVFWLLFIRS